jgi:CheY-like chemotaxis protein
MAKKILLVEDEPSVLAVAQKRLENFGYEVTAVETAELALAHLQNNLPDLILLDLLLPKMQGDELCKLLKSDDRFKRLPIILFTASSGDLQKLTKEIGGDDYIVKPYESKELLDKIEKYL